MTTHGYQSEPDCPGELDRHTQMVGDGERPAQCNSLLHLGAMATDKGTPVHTVAWQNAPLCTAVTRLDVLVHHGGFLASWLHGVYLAVLCGR